MSGTAAGGEAVRIGQGWDIHRLVAGRPMVVGGVQVPFDRGPLGHSDGDVLLHAVCDAILGALAAGDIGTHFPDSDPAWRGADSRRLLRAVVARMEGDGFRVAHLDATVLAERPRLAPHLAEIRRTLAGLLGCAEDAVSVKAKTMEGLGAIGAGEAVAAMAVVLLARR